MTKFIDNNLFDKDAKSIVKQYIAQHPNDDNVKTYGIYIVWKSHILQNDKYLISTSRNDGEYYEVTFNGNNGEWYLDVYKKAENKCFTMNDVREFRNSELYTDMV